jgi:DNA-binding MarR family transcriptional regulator
MTLHGGGEYHRNTDLLPQLWFLPQCLTFALRSKARQQLLAYYFTNPTARHHLRDLAERLSIDPSNLSKEFGRPERDGLFRSEVIGRQKYFQLNREYPPCQHL